MRLYHGSISDFETIDVLKGKGYKDFGQGFYTTSVKEHAVRLAKRNKEIELARLSRLGKSSLVTAYLYEYDFDMSLLSKFTTKVFDTADREWVMFVLENRISKAKAHNFDIVQGPTADDDTRLTLTAYSAGVYGDPSSPEAIDRLIQYLLSDKLPMQLYFGTNDAVKELVRTGVHIV